MAALSAYKGDRIQLSISYYIYLFHVAPGSVA